VAEHAKEILDAADVRLVLDNGRIVTDASVTDAAPLPTVAAPSVRGAKPVAVETRDLVHRYPGGIEAVRGVSLSIAPGETVAIVGQNGSGKTTLVKHLNGLLRPDAGSVLVGGADIANTPISDLAGEVGFVFQNPDDQLFNNRVDKEVSFGPRNLRLNTADIDKLVGAALAMTGLSDQRSTNPYDLDVSVRKLVALAGVLAMEPAVLVLDEPTAGQDGPGTERIGAIVDGWAAAGRTVLAITHDMEFAAGHFRRIAVMREGEVIVDAAPAEVFAARNRALLASTGLKPPD
jgi:energy-coupling factor transport system ATP-binding protein